MYEKVARLRDAEQGKEFELPMQGTDLSRFQPMGIGGYDKYAVRYGNAPELAKPEDTWKLPHIQHLEYSKKFYYIITVRFININLCINKFHIYYKV